MQMNREVTALYLFSYYSTPSDLHRQHANLTAITTAITVANITAMITTGTLPTLDIIHPCYSKPTEIIEMTLKACYDMDYPAEKITCWVCDDGKKEDMKNMVNLIGMQYK